MKRIVVIGPCLPSYDDGLAIVNSLDFINDYCEVSYYDPLSLLYENETEEKFVSKWREKILSLAENHDVFIGFSLGGMLIKKCFGDLRIKPCVIFSTPTQINTELRITLERIISYLQTNNYAKAISIHNGLVHYPSNIPEKNLIDGAYSEEKKRLIRGLRVVLNIGDLTIQKKDQRNLLQFVGDLSKLVTKDHIPEEEIGCTVIVPNAGMRMLQDNLDFCRPLIIDFMERMSKCQ